MMHSLPNVRKIVSWCLLCEWVSVLRLHTMYYYYDAHALLLYTLVVECTYKNMHAKQSLTTTATE